MSDAASLQFVPALVPEEQARAGFYGLIARLFYAAPDAQLLGELLHAEPFAAEDGERTSRGDALSDAWHEMVEACRTAFPVVLENEHTELFATPGKAEVTPYLLHYVMRYESETPLVELRAQLARWNLARRENVPEPEDHIAGVCEAMRHAIAVQQRPLDDQKLFFERFIYRGAMGFCDAVSASEKARFYRLVARFASAFFEIEREAFEIA